MPSTVCHVFKGVQKTIDHLYLQLAKVDLVIPPCYEVMLCIAFRGFDSMDKAGFFGDAWCVLLFGFFGFKGMHECLNRRFKVWSVFGIRIITFFSSFKKGTIF